MKVGVSVNEYDYEGDIYDTCVKLYVNDTTILKFETVSELMNFAKKILRMEDEIRENIDNV